ncbi:MAG: hypothetical protein LBT10_02550 [Methanobrevibacter sp.]|nr:hypothetical protein [Methanobrevibacter sp.]
MEQRVLDYGILESNHNGINTKLFETPKIKVGNFKLRYYETPNPGYKTT